MFKKLTTLLTALAVALPISAPLAPAALAQNEEDRVRLRDAIVRGGATEEVLAAFAPFLTGARSSDELTGILRIVVASDRDDRTELATTLVENGVEAGGERDARGMTILDLAAQHGDLPLMVLLANRGGAIAYDRPHHSAHVPYSAIVRTVQTGTPEEMRQWYSVMRFGNEEEGLRHMHDGGRDPHGNTLLHHAAIRGGDEGRHIAVIVLGEGVDAGAFNRDGKLAWELADSGTADVLQHLAAQYLSLAKLIQGGFPLEVLRDRLSGYAPAHPDDEGDDATPLHYAVSTERRDGREMEVFRLVLDNGADVNARDADGETALLWAGRKGSVEMIRALIAEGADLGARNNAGQALWEVPSPLSRVARQILADGDADKIVEPHCQYTRLHRAAEEGDVDRVRLLIELGANLEPKSTPGCRGNTPLFQTAMLLHVARVDAAKALIAGGADVNARNAYDETPLHAAAQQAHPELVELFLSEGADPEARWARGETPAEVRPEGYPPERVAAVAAVFAAFLGAGSSPPPDSGGENSSAVVSGNNATSLRDLAGNVSGGLSAQPAPAPSPIEAVIEAIVNGDANDFVDAMEQADPELLRDYRDPETGNSLLHLFGYCALNRAPDCVAKADALMVQVSINPDAQNNAGETALHVAARADSLDVVRTLLLNGGANPDIPNREGDLVYSFLQRKAESNYQLEVSMAHDLLRRFPPPGGNTTSGADLDPTWRDSDGAGHLHHAARGGDVEAMESLLSAGADINARDDSGATPLLAAARSEQERGALFLAEMGADFDIARNDGDTVINIAAERSLSALLRRAVEAGADPNRTRDNGLAAIHSAMFPSNSLDIFLTLAESPNLDLNLRDGGEGATAAHFAARNGLLDVIEELARRGADLNLQTRNGETAEDIARHAGHSEIEMFLRVHRGASPSSGGAGSPNADEPEWMDPAWREPGQGGTGLHFAARDGTPEQLRELLRRPGWADLINTPDNFGMTPLMVAAWVKRTEQFNTLKEAGASFDGVNGGGYMIVHIACEMGNLEILDAALAAGQDPNIQHGEGLLPATLGLHSPDPIGVLRILMDSGRLDLDARNAHGTTVVHDVAASSGDVEILRMLADAGADFASEGFGRTPLQWAEFRGHQAAAEFIREHLAGQ